MSNQIYIRRVWRNGSCLDSHVVCAECKDMFEDDADNMLVPGDDQTFEVASFKARCESEVSAMCTG